MKPISRRRMLHVLGLAAGASLLPWPASAGGGVVAKRIPSTGEALPVIGMGTWQTFNVGSDAKLRAARTRVLETFLQLGGGMVDSSPMYGSSQAVVGHALARLDDTSTLFSADKIWTSDGRATREQFGETGAHWGVKTFDLMQIHNLVAWQDHLAELRRMKEEKKIRYIGVTTSHGRRHTELEQIMKDEQLDFVQLTYNLADREAERRLLPLAKERGIAVIVNRPFQGGRLIDQLQREQLPSWAREFDALNWPQALLKWIVSHPAVTCAIPATSQVVHMRENMGACRGRLANADHRAKMVRLLG